MSAHSRYAPSSAPRWIPCPGSIALCDGIERTSSAAADEGTVAHFWGALSLETRNPVSFYVGQDTEEGGKTYTLDEVTAEYIQSYVDDVKRRAAGGILMVEQRLNFSNTIGVEDQAGTGDAIMLTNEGRKLTVEDFKFGLGVKVYAGGNEQGLMYILGALETFEPIMGDVEEFEFVVHQPRLDHIDPHSYTRAEIDDFREKATLAVKYAEQGLAIKEIEGIDGLEAHRELFNPGDKQCRFCPALGRCRAAAAKVAEETYGDFAALEKPHELAVRGEPGIPAGERLGLAFGVLDYIHNWINAVRAECERMVLAGMTVIGPDGLAMKVVQGKRGNRYWWDEEGAEAALQGLLPPEKLYKPKEIVSPAVAEKALGKKRKADFEQALLPFIRQKDGSLKVALGSDPAPAYSGEASAGEFPNQSED